MACLPRAVADTGEERTQWRRVVLRRLACQRLIAQANPFAYAVDAARALAAGHLGDVAVTQAFVMLGVLALLALFWATRSIRKAAL